MASSTLLPLLVKAMNAKVITFVPIQHQLLALKNETKKNEPGVICMTFGG
jgi:hypothetical protein